MPPDFELFDIEAGGELFIVVDGREWRLNDLAPQLAQSVAAAGGIDVLTTTQWQSILTEGDWPSRLRTTVSQRSVGPEFPETTQDDPGAPFWWTPEVAAVFGVRSWQEYLDAAVTEPSALAIAAGRAESRSDQIADAIRTAKSVADSITPPTDAPDGSFANPSEAQADAAAQGFDDAVVLRDPDTGRWTWDLPEMDPIARQVFTSEASAAAAAPPGFRPRAINSVSGTIWGFERIPETAAPARRSFQQIIDDNLISGNFARAMELHGLRRMLEAESETLSLQDATSIAQDFSENADEFRELFELLTREQRSAAAIAPLQLGQFESRFAQLEASRAGVAGVDPFDPRFPPDIPTIFQPGGDLGKADPRALLFPDQPEVGAALAAGTAGPSAQRLAQQRLGLGRLSGQNFALLTTRAASGAAENAIFIEDILGVDSILPEQVQGLTFEQFRQASGLQGEFDFQGAKVTFDTLRRAAGLSGPAPTTADVQNLLGERREAAAGREREAEAQRETERLSGIEARKRRTGARIFI